MIYNSKETAVYLQKSVVSEMRRCPKIKREHINEALTGHMLPAAVGIMTASRADCTQLTFSSLAFLVLAQVVS